VVSNPSWLLASWSRCHVSMWDLVVIGHVISMWDVVSLGNVITMGDLVVAM